MASTLQSMYPWTTAPFIANAPMGGFAGAELAASVTTSQSLGFIGALPNMQTLDNQLEQTKKLIMDNGVDPFTSDGRLKVGVGFLMFVTRLDAAVAVVVKHKPSTLWLSFAERPQDYKVWVEEVRRAHPKAQIWIPAGSVHDAVYVAQTCSPDVIVLQGADAGGHGLERGASIISLVPEAADALQAAGFGYIPLIAAGGIVNARGAAAAILLGAQGVVMGTRFLASKEVMLPDKGYQEAILATSDGGQTTIRSKVFDDLTPQIKWPTAIDGRGIVNLTYQDYARGVPIEETRMLHSKACQSQGKGFQKEEKRATVWAGTGVGLVLEVMSANGIVDEVRQGLRLLLDASAGKKLGI